MIRRILEKIGLPMSIQLIPGRGINLRPDGTIEITNGLVFKRSLRFRAFDETRVDAIRDEPDMVSNLDTALVTQRSLRIFASHDRQTVADQNTQVTTLIDTFEDITNATLTTKNLGQRGNYSFFFSIVAQASAANTMATFQLLINGTPEGAPRTLSIKTNNQDIGTTILGLLEGVTGGDVLQAQWKTDKGVLTMSEFNILIDGIPAARLVA